MAVFTSALDGAKRTHLSAKSSNGAATCFSRDGYPLPAGRFNIREIDSEGPVADIYLVKLKWRGCWHI